MESRRSENMVIRAMLFLSIIVLFVAHSALSHAAMYDDVNAYWKMDGTWNDSSGKGNNGTGYGGVSFAIGPYGQAAAFDGQNDYIKVSYSSDFIFSNNDPFTVSAWVKLTDVVGSHSFISTEGYDGSAYTNWNLRPVTSKSNVNMVVRNTDNSAGSVGANIAVNAWHHIVGVVDELKNITLYVDGVGQGSSSYADLNTQNGDLVMGRFYNYVNDYYLKGAIDDVAIWGRTLDTYEAASVYEVGVEKFEALLNGINGAMELGLEYTSEQISQLADLYSAQTGEVVIDETRWTYLSGDLPGDIGGTTYDIGDSWTYDGCYYVKLGSGLQGLPVPELPPFAAGGLLLGFGSIKLWVRKRRTKKVCE
jgi:hypothetical protein